MTCQSEIHVGDIGTTFRFAFLQGGEVLPLTGADELRVIFLRPDGTAFTVEAAFATDGADGLVDYVTEQGDLSQSGAWKAQAYTETGEPVTEAHHSEIVTFEVKPNLVALAPSTVAVGLAGVGVSAPSTSIVIA